MFLSTLKVAIKFKRPGRTSDLRIEGHVTRLLRVSYLMRGWNSKCGAQMSLSISKLVDVSPQAPAISSVSLTSLLLLNSSCFPGWIPDSLDSGLTEKCGQLRTSDDVVAAMIRLSIHEASGE